MPNSAPMRRAGARLLVARACRRGDRVLLFLDDTPAYPGGVLRRGARRLRAAADQHADAAGPAAVLSVEFRRDGCGRRRRVRSRFDATACDGHAVCKRWSWSTARRSATRLRASDRRRALAAGLCRHADEADTHRNEMAFWMYSSGSTGRPKGIVHLQHDMAYSDAAFGKHILSSSRTTSASRCRRFSSPMASATRSPFRSRVGATACCCRASRSRRRSSRRSRVSADGVLRPADALQHVDQCGRSGHGRLLVACGCALSAAEVLSSEVFNRWKALTGHEIVEGLGSTEVLHIYLSNRPDSEEARRGGHARARLRGHAEGQGRARGRRQRGGHHVGARRFHDAAVLEQAGQNRRDDPRGRLDLHRRPLPCATKKASTSSAAAPTIW